MKSNGFENRDISNEMKLKKMSIGYQPVIYKYTLIMWWTRHNNILLTAEEQLQYCWANGYT